MYEILWLDKMCDKYPNVKYVRYERIVSQQKFFNEMGRYLVPVWIHKYFDDITVRNCYSYDGDK